jgi:hypothetical protein
MLKIQSSNHSNPTQSINVCVCVYSVFVLSYVYVAALRRADHSSKVSYRLCKKDYGPEEEPRATMGCRAINE